MNLGELIHDIALKARAASERTAELTSRQKDAWLARAAERFEGRVEPIDPVAGHVPGAMNYAFTDSLDSDGLFRGPEEVRRRLRAVLGDADGADVIAMCGSGVTACHLLLSMEIAGLPGGRLYEGSWSEWIRDPSRPVATGPAAVKR